MKLFDRFRRDGRPPSVDGPTIELAVVMAALQPHVATLEKKAVEPALVRARLADRLRDGRLIPLHPDRFDELTSPLDASAWRRLALLVAALDDPCVSGLLPDLARDGVEKIVAAGFVAVATGARLLELELLRESAVRLEELARSWLAGLDVAITGESAAESVERLRRIDYGRLLAEAERAKQAAEERMAPLRKAQEEAEKKRVGRSKW